MNFSLFDLPPELLEIIVKYMSLPSRLRFGQTSRRAHAFAIARTDTLALSIYTDRHSAYKERMIGFVPVERPIHVPSAFSFPFHFDGFLPGMKLLNETETDRLTVVDPKARQLVPDRQYHHDESLIRRILSLYDTRSTLSKVELNVWNITPHLASTLCNLPGLRKLALRVEASIPERIHYAPFNKAWNILTTAPWAPHLEALRIENADVLTSQLASLLRQNRVCRELWIVRCWSIGVEIWPWLGMGLGARASLRILGVTNCGEFRPDSFGYIDGLKNLQFLNVRSCDRARSKGAEARNEKVWNIPEIILPNSPPSLVSRGEHIHVIS